MSGKKVSDAVQDRLHRALRKRTLVRLRRRAPGMDRLDGFVVMPSETWTMLAVLGDGVALNGFAAVRTRDIVAVKGRGAIGAFVGKALALQGTWPVIAPSTEVNVSTVSGLVETVAAGFPLVTIHLEEKQPDVCFIGRPIGCRKRTLAMHEVTPTATWRASPTRWRLKQITRVDFGGTYEEQLHRVAGAPPR